ncbi:MAG: hypothetical protein WCG23_10275 [bacterium]
MTKEELLSKDIDKKARFPQYACGVPTLHYKSNIIYDNLFTYSKKIIAASATMQLDICNTFKNP